MAPVIATPSSTRGHHATAACPPSWAALGLPVSLSAVQRVHWVLSDVNSGVDVTKKPIQRTSV